MKFLSTSEKQTFNLAKKIAKKLKGGEVIGLIGSLGAGKTIFVKGLAKGLKIKKNITSPTFVIMKIYPVAKHQKIKSLVHIDAYRIKRAKDLIVLSTKEYFYRQNIITIIEWADKIKKVLPKKIRLITITHKKNNQRIINF